MAKRNARKKKSATPSVKDAPKEHPPAVLESAHLTLAGIRFRKTVMQHAINWDRFLRDVESGAVSGPALIRGLKLLRDADDAILILLVRLFKDLHDRKSKLASYRLMRAATKAEAAARFERLRLVYPKKGTAIKKAIEGLDIKERALREHLKKIGNV